MESERSSQWSFSDPNDVSSPGHLSWGCYGLELKCLPKAGVWKSWAPTAAEFKGGALGDDWIMGALTS